MSVDHMEIWTVAHIQGTFACLNRAPRIHAHFLGIFKGPQGLMETCIEKPCSLLM